MKYSAINIGPIVKTLGLARKPRELWSASFLFSALMDYIIKEVPNGVDIISPAVITPAVCPPCSGVGLYPDRLFIKGEIPDAQMEEMINKAWEEFKKNVFSVKDDVREYFTIMNASVEADHDYEAVKKLNAILDRLELNVMTSDHASRDKVLDLIKKDSGSPLFTLGFGSNKMPVESLQKIAEASWEAIGERKSFHDYVCIVQADGDNVGSYVTSPALKSGKLKDVSSALLEFGIKAKTAIEEFGGTPVYAGGDDLLFIAPVIGRDGKTTIFDLLENLDDAAFAGVKSLIPGVKDHTPGASLSFGVAITYYKYPLYEALEMARNLLFGVAKKVSDKHAVAWTFQKHSGEQFSAAFSRENKSLWKEFMNVIDKTVDGNTVSAVAHKIREFGPLVHQVLESSASVRLDALFDNVLEMKNNDYFKAVKEIMPTLYGVCRDNFSDVLYAILRTAKFVKGEEPKDE